MATLQTPQQGERLSQILPTVKCSTCNQPVTLAELGDHVCPPPPTPSTPRPSAILAKIRQASQSNTTNDRNSTSSRSALGLSFRRSKTPQPKSSPPLVSPPPKPATPAPILPIRQQSPQPPTPRHQSPTSYFDLPIRSGTPQAPLPLQIPPPTSGPRTAPPMAPPSFLPGTPSTRRPSVSSVVSHQSRFRAPSAPEQTNLPADTSNPMSRSAPNQGPFPPLPAMDRSRMSIDRPGSARPSTDMRRPSMDRPGSTRPSMDTRPSFDGINPLSAGARQPTSPLSRMSPGTGIGVGPGPGAEVNMAGVGRRGFHAAVQAAMLASTFGKEYTQQDRFSQSPLGMDGRRINAPSHLSINANVIQQPPSNLSPITPLSSHSPHSPSPQSPNGFPQIASSRTPSPLNPSFLDGARSMTPKSQETIRGTDDLTSSPPRLSPKPLEIDTSVPSKKSIPSPVESEYSEGGLAYDQETESVTSPKSPTDSISTTKAEDRSKDRILFPTEGSPQMSISGLPMRSASSASSYSYASRTTAKSTGALVDRALDPLFEDARSPPSPSTPLSPQNRSPKLPMRSRTTPAMSSKTTEANAARKRRQCTRCNKMIDDGRWIRAEGAGVLCERCWKTMYLPKCRRCNRPIEKQAVSSADGQLKGKYHRECFNCFKCHQSFPDKEFYVYDGKPFCRYHYHEANDSLCADPSCGQPIEGACAVAHTGERYHPEHLVCEHRFSTPDLEGRTRCTERLEEYWEVDGLMLCERHANLKIEMDIMAPDDDEDDVLADLVAARLGADGNRDSLHDPDSRAHRRKTRFIDLR